MKIKLIILSAFLVLGARYGEAMPNLQITDPASGATQKDSVKVTTTTASAAKTRLIFTMTGGYYYTGSGQTDSIQWTGNTGSGAVVTSFYFNPATITSNTYSVSNSGGMGSLPDGTYTVSGNYYTGSTWIPAVSNKTNVKIDTKTLPPAFMLPVDSTTVGNSFVIRDSIPEADYTHTKTITFTGANTYVLTLTDALKDSFALNVTNPLSSSSVYSMTNGPSIANGTYTMTFSYQDALGHTAALSASRTITINAVTPSPVITSPTASASIGGHTMSFQFTIPDNYKHGTVNMVFDSLGSMDTVVFKNTLAKGANTVTLNSSNLLSSAYVQSATANSLNGIYNITLSYQDSAGYPASSTTVNNVSIDNTTQTATLLSPINATFGGTDSLLISFSLPEAASNGSVQAVLTHGSASCTIAFLTQAQGTTSAVINRQNVVLSAGVSANTCMSIADGTYSLTIQYQDAFGNAIATSNAGAFVMDYTTLAPSLIAPVTNDTTGQHMPVKFNLPEAPLGGFASLVFYNSGTSQADTLLLENLTAGVDSLTLDAKNLLASASVQSATVDSLTDGVYSVRIVYQDSLSNPASYAISTNVTVDQETLTPTLVFPVNAVGGGVDPAYFNFVLPEAAADSTVQIIFDNGTSPDTLTLRPIPPGTTFFYLDPKNLTYLPGYKSSTIDSLPDGTYTVTLQYRDVYGNPAATSNAGTLLIDETTLPPTITLPVTGSATAGTMNVSFSLPEKALGNLVSLELSGPYVIQMHVQTSGSGVQSYALNMDSLQLSPGVSGPSRSSVPDGIYTMTITYNDSLWNSAASAFVSNIKIDKTTLSPVIMSPTDSATMSHTIVMGFILPESPAAGSVKLVFNGTSVSDTLVLTNITSGSNSFTLDSKNLSASSYVISASVDSLPDDPYSITLSYQDSLDNPVASATVSNLTLDNTTLTPSLLSPINHALVGGGNPLSLSFTLPETPQAHSVTITFNNGVNPICTLILNTDSAGMTTINLNPQHLFITPGLVSTTYDSLFDGHYTITLTYQDYLGNPVATANMGTMILDETTQSPVILAPANSGTIINLMNFVFTIPENYKPNSLKLVFDSAGVKDTVLLKNTMPVGTDTLTLESYNITGNFFVQSATKNNLGDGVYTITLSYRDSLGNLAASATVTNITLDQETTPPVLISPTNVLQATGSVFSLQYTLPEAPLSGTVQVAFINNGAACYIGLDESTAGSKSDLLDLKSIPTSFAVSTHSCNSLDDGSYKVVLMYQDAFDNGVAASDTGLLIIDTQTLTPSLTLPGSGSTNNAMVAVSFTLPENALNSKASLTFASLTDTITIDLQTSGTGLQSFTLNGDDLSATSGYLNASQSTIPDGTYTLMLTYQDTLSNPSSSVFQNSIEISRPIVTGIHEGVSDNSVNIYPNPSNGMFTIHSTIGGMFTIMDELGNVIRTIKLDNANNYTATNESLSSGIYFIVGYNHSSITRQKLVIVK